MGDVVHRYASLFGIDRRHLVPEPSALAHKHDWDEPGDVRRFVQTLRDHSRRHLRHANEMRMLHGQLRALSAKAARFLWPLADLDDLIRTSASENDISQDKVEATRQLLRSLHSAALGTGIRCLPAPSVGFNPDVGLELEWFYRKRNRVLTFAVTQENQTPSTWMFWSAGAKSGEETDPLLSTIVGRLCWVAGVKPVKESA